ncbi:MAG: tyrosine-type recombinase/integrase [Desulfobacteraceae bacterium]|nr:tyrosine-type recombinase/integrase [Desulfobacteraceae bacterium]
MRLSTCIYHFFDQYLPRIKGSNRKTIKAYRDAFTIFLPFASRHLGIKIDSLKVDHLSSGLILAFLDYLESDRGNAGTTRNQRLAALKSLAKMMRFMYPQNRDTAERILSILQKRTQRKLIGFLYPDEIFKIFCGVELTNKNGLRDYTILHLLDDAGARASEIATLNLDYFNTQQKTLAILGKGNRFRLIELSPKTTELIKLYMTKYRVKPKPLYQHRLFINQRGTELTRHGIYRICKKYLTKALVLNVSKTSIQSIAFVIRAQSEYSPAESRSRLLKITWAMKNPIHYGLFTIGSDAEKRSSKKVKKVSPKLKGHHF